MAMPLRRPAPTPSRQPSQRMNSGTPATRAAQSAAIRATAPRQQQAVPRVQPLPRQPADPYSTNAPYRAPKPVYSDADYKRAMDTDFDYARRAADIATGNAIRRDRAGVDARSQANLAGTRAQAAAQRMLNAQQNSAADRAQQRAIEASDRAQSRQVGLGREQIAANERANATRAAAAVAAAGLAGVGGTNIARINADAQERIAKANLDMQRYQFDTQMQRQRDLDSPIRLRTQEQNAANLQARIVASQLSPGGGASGFRSGGVTTMATGRSGGTFAMTGGGTSSVSGTSGPTTSALDLAKEASKAAADRQAAQLASTERLQTERVQLERDRPMLAANAEEELRKRARDAAMRLFNSARPGMTPTVT